MNNSPQLVPATCLALAVDHDGPLCGIALLGPSGAGKSQTALSLLSSCTFRRSRLISDDITRIRVEKCGIFAEPAPIIEGAIELRGTGISTISFSERHLISFAFRIGLQAERQPANESSWSPFGAEEHRVPEYRWTRGHEGMIFFLRAILSGHSSRAGFDSIPETGDEEGFS